MIKTLILSLCCVAALAISAAAQTVVVTPANTQGWASTDLRPGGAVNYVVDATAPAGIGALQLTTDDTNVAKADYMHAANIPLSGVTRLEYSTKKNNASMATTASYQLPVCLGGITTSGCVGFTTLVFEPYQANGVCCTPIPTGQWQTWDVDAGSFWSSQNYNDFSGCSVAKGFGGPPFYTLAGLSAACPSAVVVGFGVNVGSFNPNYNSEVDLVGFNSATYDFEPYIVARSQEQCKNGGWSSVKRANGTGFKNQGDCIQYVNTGK